MSRVVAVFVVLLLAGCGTTTRTDTPTQPVVTQPQPPAGTPPAPPAPPAPPPSINGRYLGQTVVSAKTWINEIPRTAIQTDFNIAESAGAVTAVGKIVPTDNPAETADVTATGTRTDTQLTFSFPFNPACGNVTLKGTIQTDGNITFPAGTQDVNCSVMMVFIPTTIVATVNYDPLTLVKQ